MATFGEHLDAPDRRCFTFDDPPMTDRWRAEFHVSPAGAAFLHHFQLMLGMNTVARGDEHWEVGSARWWQDGSGVSVRQWKSVMTELGDTGAGLLSFVVTPGRSTKSVFIRPTYRFLDVFGLCPSTYDAVARLDAEISCQLNPWTRTARGTDEIITPDEIYALQAWMSRGGLSRVRNPGRLCALSKSGTDQPHHLATGVPHTDKLRWVGYGGPRNRNPQRTREATST
jgi:hypothetical protein